MEWNWLSELKKGSRLTTTSSCLMGGRGEEGPIS